MRIILASKSPRRREILAQLGMKFEIIVSEADENSDIREPQYLVRELALRKGKAVFDFLIKSGEDTSDVLIIASDTIVYCDGEIIGKPKDRHDAKRMLHAMSGKGHTVYTGIASIYSGNAAADVSRTEVFFASMSDDEIEGYLNTAEYADKAGAYAVQGGASLFIDGIHGDYFTVVGMPVRKLSELLQREFGISMPALCGHWEA